MKVEDIARACHEVNRAYCAAIGDNSQLAWEDAPDWQRESAMNGVEFTLVNPDAGPSASHESWLAEKERDGWTYGPVKNPAIKEHPCFVPYDELPTEQKVKDYLFQAVVRSLASRITSARTVHYIDTGDMASDEVAGQKTLIAVAVPGQ